MSPTEKSATSEPSTGQGGFISPSRSAGMLAANVWGAISMVAVTAVAARVLNESDYTQFLVYWSLLFGVLQIVTGVQNESARATSEVLLVTDDRAPHLGTRIIAMPLILAGVLGVVVAISGPLWARHVSVGVVVLMVSAIVVVSYGCEFAVFGVLAGRHQWGTLAFLNALGPTVRISGVVAVAFLIPTLKSMQLAAVLPELFWLATILALWRVRSATLAISDVPLNKLLANGVRAMFAASASAVLLNAFPAIVRLALGDNTAGLASLLLGIQLTRAPLMMPLVAFQGLAVAGFVAARRNRLRALMKPFGAVVALGALVAVSAALIGPLLMRLLFGANYELPGIVLGGLAFAAVSIALLTLSGTAAIAVGDHRSFMMGWIIGAAVTVVLLFVVPIPAASRVIMAVLVGPLVGVAVHVAAIRRSDHVLVA